LDEPDSLIFRSILLFALLGCSAFFSACEVAFFSLNQLQVSSLKDKKGVFGRLVFSLLSKPRELLVTIYIGNEIVNVAISALTTSIAYNALGNLGVALAIGVGTFLLLLFGEIIPKTFSFKFAETYTLIAAFPLSWFGVFVRPIQKLFVGIGEWLMKLCDLDDLNKGSDFITDEEIKTIVDIGENEGNLESQESEMIHNVIRFGETTVSEIMTPKIDMFTLRIDEKLEEILPKIMKNFYSRVPVFDVEGESISGILYTKDLNKLNETTREKFNLKGLLHDSLRIPESKKIKELLQEFKKMKRHLAIVLDEYGSLSGIVTLEDILEELVGEIDSEMRTEENPINPISLNQYRINATLTISEFNKFFQCKLPDSQYDTIGGMVFGLIGRVPRSGEIVPIQGFRFQVEKMKGSRILKLKCVSPLKDTEKTKEKALSEKQA